MNTFAFAVALLICAWVWQGGVRCLLVRSRRGGGGYGGHSEPWRDRHQPRHTLSTSSCSRVGGGGSQHTAHTLDCNSLEKKRPRTNSDLMTHCVNGAKHCVLLRTVHAVYCSYAKLAPNSFISHRLSSLQWVICPRPASNSNVGFIYGPV